MGSARSAVAVFTTAWLFAMIPTLVTPPHAASLAPVSLTAATVPVNLDALDSEPALTQLFETGAADATMGTSESALDMYNELTTQFGVLVELVALNILLLFPPGLLIPVGLSIALDAGVVTVIGDNIIDVLTGSPVPLPVLVPVLPGLTEPFSKIFDQIPDIGGFDTAGGSAADGGASAGADTADSAGADLATGFDLPL
jgi:hypothetical protein